MLKEIADREEVFKAEKVSLQKKYQQEMEKLKVEIKKRQVRIAQSQAETKAMKDKNT